MIQFKKFGKTISYNINPQQGHWMVVQSDGDIYMYITKNGLDVPNFKAKPEFVNKKNYWDLAVHFGIPKKDLARIFQK